MIPKTKYSFKYFQNGGRLKILTSHTSKTVNLTKTLQETKYFHIILTKPVLSVYSSKDNRQKAKQLISW